MQVEFQLAFFFNFEKKSKMDCLENIIGITNNNCPCLHEGLTPEQIEELSISKSGLYLDEVEGGIVLRNVQYMDKCLSFIDIQKNAIQTAIQHFSTDLFSKLNEKYQMKKMAFLGEIGRPTISATLSTTKRLQFLKLTPKADSDGIVHLNRIRVFLNADTTTKIWLIEVQSGQMTTILEQEVSSVDKILTINTAVNMPLKKNGQTVQYFAVFEQLGAIRPRNIKTSCGCANGDAFAKFVDAGGGEVDSFSQLPTSNTDIWTHGFSLDVHIKCETGSLICREYDENDAVAKVTAFAILYKAGELVIENVLNSGEVNRFTMLSNERLWGKRDHFKYEYKTRIEYLSKVIDVTSSDCFICRSNDFFVGNIVN